MTMPAARILMSGDTAVVIEFGDTIDRRISALVLGLDQRLTNASIPGVVETVPTLRSLMVHYDPSITSFGVLSERIAEHLADVEGREIDGRLWTIPACYDLELAPDLEEVATATGLTPDDVVALHSGTTYRVYMLGFLPGHPYMGDLPAPLQLPRRQSPRTLVPPGSIAIATSMTSIYPLASPGGWHLIGRTPINLFDTRRDPPVLLSPADQIRFRRIGRSEYDEIAARAATDPWTLVADGAGLRQPDCDEHA